MISPVSSGNVVELVKIKGFFSFGGSSAFFVAKEGFFAKEGFLEAAERRGRVLFNFGLGATFEVGLEVLCRGFRGNHISTTR